ATCSTPHVANAKPEKELESSYAGGDTVTFVCDSNYELEGTSYALCDDGTWRLPVCKVTSYIGKYIDDVTVSKTITTRSNQKPWMTAKHTTLSTGSPQGCVLSPLPFTLLTHDCVMHSSNHIIKFIDDTTVCNRGYEFDGTKEEAECVGGGWKLPQCKKRITCGKPVVRNSETDRTLRNSYNIGDKVQFKCRSSYEFVDTDFAECVETGTWNLPECRPRSAAVCKDPRVSHGRPAEDLAESYPTRSSVRFECDRGYVFEGSAFAVCINGQWILPVCKRINSCLPPSVPNARPTSDLKDSYSSGDTVRFVCDRGYGFEGTRYAVCDEGTWSLPVCKDVTCSTPHVANGKPEKELESSYAGGDTVRFVCDTDYQLEGTSYALCDDGTWRLPVCQGKGRELADMMERRKVDILCVQETRWKGSKARSIGAGFKLFYYGVDSKRNGVGVVLKEEFVRNVLEVKRVSDRVMSLKLEIEGVMLNVVSGYAPQVGCELEEKERFWSELDEVMESIPTGERVVIGADFNGHVGEGNTGDEEVMGKFGVKERNLEGQMVVDFAKRMDMAVVNTYFQKREEHRVTYKSGGRRTQVDYILCRRGNLKEISDCKVVVGESVARQHRMVVCRMTLMVCKKKRSKIEKKTKWWKLKKEECCEEFRQKLRQALGGQVVLPDDWETTAEVIRETGRKVLGVSSGRRKEDKETWWWNEEVQDSIQRKRLAKKKWDMDRTEENRQEYKELQRRVKREVSKAKQKAYDELYTRLDTREGEKDLYRLARQRDRDGKDVQQVRVIKDRDGRVLKSEESVQRRWKEYFEELMNEENEREKRVEGVNSVEQKVDKIRKDEVRRALKRMKSGKAVGPDDIPVEVWKCLGEAAVEFIASLFNRVLESERMPEEWRRSVLVPIFKNKGDVQSCSNYRGIKLMSHTMKVWERAVEARLRKVVEICEQQYGFMPRKSTTDAIFALRILMEKYRDGQRELHCVFVDLEKAYDRVPREELWYCMRKSGVAEKYVRVVQDMYERSRTVVRCAVGQTEEFNVEVGLHQGSALSPFLFAIVMYQLSEEVRQESPWTMMFADDIVICSESREQVEENLERWRFERRGMKVSGSKTEYMCVNEREGSGTVRLQGEEVKNVQEFKYLGSTVQSNRECGKEVRVFGVAKSALTKRCTRVMVSGKGRQKDKTWCITPHVPNAQPTHELESSYPVDATVAFQCNRGYQFDGTKEEAECVDGSWKLPQCKRSRYSCGAPARVNYVIITQPYQDAFEHTDQLHYVCAKGYKASRGAYSSCSSGSWYPEIKCERITCGKPVVRNGETDRTLRNSYNIGDKVQFKCRSSYEFVDTDFAECVETGTWNLPECRLDGKHQDNAPCHKADMLQEWFDEHSNQFEVLTWPPNSPDLNPIQHLWDVLDNQVHGGPISQLTGLKGSAANILVPDPTAHLQGPSGVHALTGQGCFGSKRRNNTILGERGYGRVRVFGVAKSALTKRCTRVMVSGKGRQKDKTWCITPHVPNAQPTHELESSYPVDATVAFQCNRGYQFDGTKEEAECVDGSWKLPQCKRSRYSCGAPARVNYVIITQPYQDAFEHTDQLHYVCAKGYKASRGAYSSCSSGSWYPEIKCERITCGKPVVRNGETDRTLRNSYNIGDKVQFKCRSSYEFVDTDFAECVETGTWNLPECRPRSATVCKDPRVSHGRPAEDLAESYPTKSSVRFECDRGYVFEGSAFAVCTNGQWDLPVCKLRDCGDQPLIENGDVSQLPSGKELRVQCKVLYKRVGPEIVRCGSGGWTELPVCKPPCKLDKRRIHSSHTEEYLPEGERKSFYCASGRAWTDVQCINGQAAYSDCYYGYGR
ncbi:hypothetical protein QTP70_029961, partial [Hemibagrus guttatus]